MSEGADVGSDPLRALTRRNWLLPGSWLARSTRVDRSLYDGMPCYRECTFLALRFCTSYTMRWLQVPTVVYHLGSPHAESRSRAYVLGQVQSVRALLALPLPWWMRRRLRQEIAAAYHDGADRLWMEGALRDAWRLHAHSLRSWGGVRYLPFTRNLLSSTWHRALSRPRSTSR